MTRFILASLSALLLAVFTLPAQAQTKVPDWLAGKTFTAVGVDADGNSWYSDFIFPADGGEGQVISHDNADCNARLIPVKVEDKRVLFSELMIKPDAPCYTNVWVEIYDDNITGLILADVSLLKGMAPLNSRAVLNDTSSRSYTRDELEYITTQWAKPEPTILGHWEYASGNWFSADCNEEMNRADKPWLPYEARGSLTIWAIPTDHGGKVYAAWPGGMTDGFEMSKDVEFRELTHWNEDSFVTDGGIDNMEGRVFVGLDRKKDPATGKRRLYLAPDGGSSYDIDYLKRCRAR